MKQRLKYIDLLRGLSIFLVVFGHIVVYYAPENVKDISNSLGSFRMGLLFFISGYINNVIFPIENLNTKQYFVRKIETLILPYISWSLLVPLYSGNYMPTSISDILDKFMFFPNKGIWFLPVLFIFFSLYTLKVLLLKQMAKTKLQFYNIILNLIIVSFFVIIGIALYEYFLIVYGIYFATFCFGELLWNNDRIKACILKESCYGTCAILLPITLFFYPFNTSSGVVFTFLNLLFIVLNSFLACIFFYNFFIKVELPIWLEKGLSKIGKNSITIYLIPITLLPMTYNLPKSWPIELIFLLLIILAIIVTYIRYILGQFIYNIPLIRYILFGRKK